MKTEFHVHTRFSHDSILTALFIGIMCKLRNIKCLVITDHNEVKGAQKFQKKFKKYGISIIVGEEIFTKEGEIIGLFLKNKIEPNLSAKETIKQIKKQGGLVYIPHPYEPYRYKTVLQEKCIKDNKEAIDLIEIHNGRNRDKEISKRQEEIAKKYNLRGIIGGDSHTFFELGRNSIFLEDISKEKILKAIEQGKVISKKYAHPLAHFWTKIAKLLKMIGKGDINGICRAINRKCKRKK